MAKRLPHFSHLCLFTAPKIRNSGKNSSHCQSLSVMNFSVSSDCLQSKSDCFLSVLSASSEMYYCYAFKQGSSVAQW